MREINLPSWASFKEICIARKNLNCQYAEAEAYYDLYGPDSAAILWCYSIAKKLPDGADNPDCLDFVANNKDAFNWVIGDRPYPFSTSDFDHAANRIPVTSITEWTDDHADLFFKIDEVKLYMNGGELTCYEGFIAGDWAEMFIMDKDGAYYPQGSILKQWVYGKNLQPGVQAGVGVCHCNTPYAGNPPINTYLCVRYHRADSNSRVLGANFELHRAIYG